MDDPLELIPAAAWNHILASIASVRTILLKTAINFYMQFIERFIAKSVRK